VNLRRSGEASAVLGLGIDPASVDWAPSAYVDDCEYPLQMAEVRPVAGGQGEPVPYGRGGDQQTHSAQHSYAIAIALCAPLCGIDVAQGLGEFPAPTFRVGDDSLARRHARARRDPHAEAATACSVVLGRQVRQPSRVLLADSGAAAPQCGQRCAAKAPSAASQSKANG
jgi:hypothetical protein